GGGLGWGCLRESCVEIAPTRKSGRGEGRCRCASRGLALPGEFLQMRLQRRIRDIAGVVRDRRRRNDRDRFKQEILAVAGCEETLDILLIELPALFDQRTRQCRERAELFIRRRAAIAHPLDINGVKASL